MSFTNFNLNQLKKKNPFLDPNHFIDLLCKRLNNYKK